MKKEAYNRLQFKKNKQQNRQQKLQMSKDAAQRIDRILELSRVNLSNSGSLKQSQWLFDSQKFVKEQFQFLFDIINQFQQQKKEDQKKIQCLKVQLEKQKKAIQQGVKTQNQKDKQEMKKNQKLTKGTITKNGGNIKMGPEQLFKETKQTKKRTQNQHLNQFKFVQNSITQFQIENKNPNITISKDKPIKQQKASNRPETAQQKINRIMNEITQKQQMRKIIQERDKSIRMLQIDIDNLKINMAVMKIDQKQDKNKLKQYQNRYNKLQNQYGNKKTQYQLKLQALRNKLKQIQINNSPKKIVPVGYYSINQQSFNSQFGNQSQSQSQFSQRSDQKSHITRNYKQQNEYLREQLIKQLDKNGQLRFKIMNSQKSVKILEQKLFQINLKLQFKSQQLSNISLHSQNNQLNQSKINQQIFKKGKQSIYMVQNTDKNYEKQNQNKRKQQIRYAINLILLNLGLEFRYINQLRTFEKINKISQLVQKLIQKNKNNEKQINELQIECVNLKDDNQKQIKRLFHKMKSYPKLSQQISQKNDILEDMRLLKNSILFKQQYEIDFKNINKIQKFALKKVVQLYQILVDTGTFMSQKDIGILYKSLKSTQLRDFIQQYLEKQWNIQDHQQLKNKIKQPIQNKIQPMCNNIQPVCNKIHIEDLSHLDSFKQKITYFYKNILNQFGKCQQKIIQQHIHNGQNNLVKKKPNINEQNQQYLINKQKWLRIQQKNNLIIRNSQLIMNQSVSTINNNRVQKLDQQVNFSKSFMNQDCFNDIIINTAKQYQICTQQFVKQLINVTKNQNTQNQALVSKKTDNQLWNLQLQNVNSRIPLIQSDRNINQQNKGQVDIDAVSQSVCYQELQKQKSLLIKQQNSYNVGINHKKTPTIKKRKYS